MAQDFVFELGDRVRSSIEPRKEGIVVDNATCRGSEPRHPLCILFDDGTHDCIVNILNDPRFELIKKVGKQTNKKMKKIKFQVGDYIRTPNRSRLGEFRYTTIERLSDLNNTAGPALWGRLMNEDGSNKDTSEGYIQANNAELVCKKGQKLPAPNFLVTYLRGGALIAKEYKATNDIRKDVEALARERTVDLDSLKIYNVSKVGKVKVKITV